MKKVMLSLLATLCSVMSYSQFTGKWKTTDATAFNNPAETVPLDSVTITFKKNGNYTMDLYSIEAFPFHKQPWENYFKGQWMLSKNRDTLICYNNTEKWIHETARQDFIFAIKQIDDARLVLEGYGKEKVDDDNYVVFSKTPMLQMTLIKME